MQSEISFNLATTTTVLGAVGDLTLPGSDNLNGTGNALDNVLIGNAGANLLERRCWRGRAQRRCRRRHHGRWCRGRHLSVVDNAGDIVEES